MNKFIVAIVVILTLTILGGGAYILVLRNKLPASSSVPTNSETTKQTKDNKRGEPKTEEFVSKRVQEFWEAAKFNDHRAKYRLLDNQLKSQLSEDEYLQRQEWLDKNDLSGVIQIEKAEVGTVTLLENAAEVRITITANTGEFSDITKLIYEDGEWHKVFESYDTLGIGKSFEEFVVDNESI
ncbi:MAG: hypothetical protein Q8P73_04105 [bacterium]|nr:hypothetical protein [bacterium]